MTDKHTNKRFANPLRAENFYDQAQSQPAKFDTIKQNYANASHQNATTNFSNTVLNYTLANEHIYGHQNSYNIETETIKHASDCTCTFTKQCIENRTKMQNNVKIVTRPNGKFIAYNYEIIQLIKSEQDRKEKMLTKLKNSYLQTEISLQERNILEKILLEGSFNPYGNGQTDSTVVYLLSKVNNENEYIGLIQKKESKKWTLPGGKRQKGEKVIDTLFRYLDIQLEVKLVTDLTDTLFYTYYSQEPAEVKQYIFCIVPFTIPGLSYCTSSMLEGVKVGSQISKIINSNNLVGQCSTMLDHFLMTNDIMNSTEYTEEQTPDHRFLTNDDINELIGIVNDGSTQSQIEDFKLKCYKRNKSNPPSKTTVQIAYAVGTWNKEANRKEFNPSKNIDIKGVKKQEPNQPEDVFIYSSQLFNARKQTWSAMGSAFSFAANMSPITIDYYHPSKYRTKIILAGVFTGQYDQVCFMLNCWISNSASTSVPAILNGIVLTGLQNEANPFCAAVALGTSSPTFELEFEMQADISPIRALFNPTYLHIECLAPNVNTGAVRVYITTVVHVIGFEQQASVITGVSIDPALSMALPLDVNVVNTSSIQVDVTNPAPISVNIANTTPISVSIDGEVDAIIKDFNFPEGRQSDLVYTYNTTSLPQVQPTNNAMPMMGSKYDHKGKEPNDINRWYNLFEVLKTLPDTILGFEIDDDDNDMQETKFSKTVKHIEDQTIEGRNANRLPLSVQKTTTNYKTSLQQEENKPKKIAKKNIDKMTSKEFNGILDSANNAGPKPTSQINTLETTKIDNNKLSSERLRLSNMFHSARKCAKRIKSDSNGKAEDVLRHLCKYYINYYLDERNNNRYLSKFFIRRLLYNLNLDIFIPIFTEVTTNSELIVLCGSIALRTELEFEETDGDVVHETPEYRKAANELYEWAANHNCEMYDISEDTEGLRPIKEQMTLIMFSLGEKITKYSHMGKEPNDSIEEEVIMTDENLENSVDHKEDLDHLETKYLVNEYPNNMNDLHNFLENKAQIEMFVLKQIAKELAKEKVTIDDANHYIRGLSRDPNLFDKLVTTIANTGTTDNKYLGPGYVGGSYLPITSLDELGFRFALKPGSDIDSIARVHDLIRTLHTSDNAQIFADNRMIELIDSIQDPDIRSKVSRFAIQNFALPYAKYVMDAGRATTLNEPTVVTTPVNTEAPVITTQESLPNRNEILKTIGDMTYDEYIDYKKKFKYGPTNQEMHAMNGNTVNLDKLKKMVTIWMDNFVLNKDGNVSLFGYKTPISSNVLGNADFILYLDYLRYRGASTTEKLIYKTFNTERPIDGFSGMPQIAGVVINMGTILNPSGGPGPDLVVGDMAGMFEKGEEEEVTKVINMLRTNTPITSATTNFGIWALTRDATGNKHMIGSNAMILTKLWLTLDQMSASTEYSPIWNNADDRFYIPGNNTANQPVGNYFPLYGINGIVIRYWAMTQQEWISINYSSRNINVGNFNLAKAIFVFINSDYTDPTYTTQTALLTATELPFPLLNFAKNGDLFGTVNNFPNIAFVSSVGQSTIDYSKRTPEVDGAVRYFNVVYVLAGASSTTLNNGWDYNFTVPIAGGVRSDTNNPVRAGGIPIVDNGGVGSIGAVLRAASATTANGSARTIEQFWSTNYGTDEELARAFHLYALVKFRFVKAPCLHTTMNTTLAGNNIDGAVVTRNGGGVRLVGQAADAGGYDTAFQYHDMHGLRMRDVQQSIFGYMYSKMADKYKLALITNIRKIDKGKLEIEGVPPIQPEQRAIFGLEYSTAYAMIYSKYLEDIGLPRTQYSTYEGANIGASNEISMQTKMLNEMLKIVDKGDFITRKQTNWAGGFNTSGTIYDSYSITPIVQELLFEGQDCWDNTEMSDTRKLDTIVSAQDMIKSSNWNSSTLGVLANLPNFGHNGNGYRLQLEAFKKLWQPNIVMLGIENIFLEYNLPNDRRLYIGNQDTFKAFIIMNPTILPSGRSYFTQISTHVQGQNAVATLVDKMFVYPPSLYLNPPDTNKDDAHFNIVISSSLVNFLLTGTQRLFQSRGEGYVSIQLFPSATIQMTPKRLTNFGSDHTKRKDEKAEAELPAK